MLGYNLIVLNTRIEVLADYPGCLSWKSLGGLIAIDPTISDISDYTLTNTTGLATFTKLNLNSNNRFLVMTTVLAYLLKLEYSFKKIYWFAGKFSVSANLLGYLQVGLGNLQIYDEAVNVRSLVNCSNVTLVKVGQIFNCSVNILQPYPYTLLYLNKSARPNSIEYIIVPNITTSNVSYLLFLFKIRKSHLKINFKTNKYPDDSKVRKYEGKVTLGTI